MVPKNHVCAVEFDKIRMSNIVYRLRERELARQQATFNTGHAAPSGGLSSFYQCKSCLLLLKVKKNALTNMAYSLNNIL